VTAVIPPPDLPPLVLASASPRRREILAGLGVAFTPRTAALDESPRPGETPAELARRLAEEKATAVVGDGEIALGADTVVAVDGVLLGKPADDAEAAAMLGRLSDREHEAITGVALVGSNGVLAAGADRTLVRFRALSREEIAWYVATGEPRDKAGAYGVQGLGGLLVAAIAGSHSNVVGLPVGMLGTLFRRAGLDLRWWMAGAGDRAAGRQPINRRT
jgi:septum formation protein